MIRLLDFTESKDQILTQIEAIFEKNGYLSTGLHLQHRPGQTQMARAIAQAISNNDSLIFEAGTGIGKSLAYLIPGIIHSVTAKRPFVVSTHTISLQEQIVYKDLELCRTLFRNIPELNQYEGFQHALLVGKRNYLCNHRLRQAIIHRAELFANEDFDVLQQINDWAKTSSTGLLEELSIAPKQEIWEWVNADSSTCNSKNCSPETCFYRRARSRIKNANVLIVNHSLLFSLFNAGLSPVKGRGVLYVDDFIVIDEAHTLYDIATDHLGVSLSAAAISYTLKMLYNPRRKKGLLTKLVSHKEIMLIEDALYANDLFFNGIIESKLASKKIQRLTKSNWIDPFILPELRKVIDLLTKSIAIVDDESMKNELKDSCERLLYFYRNLQDCITLSNDKHVYWIEKTGVKGTNVNLRSAPIDCSKELNHYLFSRETSTILTSATLGVDKDLNDFKNKMGAYDAITQSSESPFDYLNQMQIFIATDCPPPNLSGGHENIHYLTESIAHFTKYIAGGTLVLFTNYTDMFAVANQLESHFECIQRPFYCQGKGQSRSQLTQQFKAEGNAILFGTNSFWTGIDVPGSALSQVIITRLPFENPSHPVSEARSEWIKSLNKNPFTELVLPEALIKFRQGVGRLIRSQEDRGIITILDSRIFSKSYGPQFLSILPTPNYTRFKKTSRPTSFSVFQNNSKGKIM